MEPTENTTNETDCQDRVKYSKLSKGQKRLADYVRQNYDKAVFLTAARLGEIVGVSESTVVRFATQLGYKGYPGFQKALEELVRNKLNSIQRMEVTYGRISQSEILETVLHSDIEKIKQTCRQSTTGVQPCDRHDPGSRENLCHRDQKLCSACVVPKLLSEPGLSGCYSGDDEQLKARYSNS